jgi:ATP-binding cassette subfamily B protein
MVSLAALRRRGRPLYKALGLQWRAAPAASAVVLLLTASSGSVGAVGAWLVKSLIDEISREGAAGRSRALGLAAAGAAVAGAAFVIAYVTQYLNTLISRRVAMWVDRSLFEKVLGLPSLRHFEDSEFQGRLRMAEQAAKEAPHHVIELVQSIIRNTLIVATLVGVVSFVSLLLAMLLLLVGLTAVTAQLVRSRADIKLVQQIAFSERWRDSYRALLLDIKAAKEIRLFELGAFFLGRMMRETEAAAGKEIALERRAALLQGSLGGATALLCAAGALVVTEGALDGQFHAGDITLFFAAFSGIQHAFAGLLVLIGTAGRTISMFKHYLDILDLPPPPAGRAQGSTLPRLRRGIELRDVWFRYHADSPWVLRGVNLTIGPTSAVGIVGVNGAGKSTLVKLLCGFYELERGEILWDGVDLRDIEPRALRRRIGATFQDFMTYDLTAQENIGLGDLARLGDVEEIRQAARRAQIDGTLASLPRGFQTLLGRSLPEAELSTSLGTTLSGGEWQRVALARSLFRQDVDLLILDEPTASLDAAAELHVHQALHAHAAGRARLLISHRLSALRGADLIAVLSAGQIVERGTHETLMDEPDGEYARLFRLQAGGYQDERVLGPTRLRRAQ